MLLMKSKAGIFMQINQCHKLALYENVSRNVLKSQSEFFEYLHTAFFFFIDRRDENHV